MSNYIADQLFDAVDKILDSKLATAGFDKTIRAVVKEVLDEIKGKYSIEYEGSRGVAWSIGQVKYDINDEVYVMVPGQIGQREKYILSKVDLEVEEKDKVPLEDYNEYIFLGRSLINWQELYNPSVAKTIQLTNTAWTSMLSWKIQQRFSKIDCVFTLAATDKTVLNTKCELKLHLSNGYDFSTMSVIFDKPDTKIREKISFSWDSLTDSASIDDLVSQSLSFWIRGDAQCDCQVEFIIEYEEDVWSIVSQETLVTMLNSFPYIAIGADFQVDDNDYYDNYGLKLIVVEGGQEREIILDINDMVGDPYYQGDVGSYTYDSQQKIVPRNGTITAIKTFEFFSDKPLNCKIKNIFIYGAEKKKQIEQMTIQTIEQIDDRWIRMDVKYNNSISIFKDLSYYGIKYDIRWLHPILLNWQNDQSAYRPLSGPLEISFVNHTLLENTYTELRKVTLSLDNYYTKTSFINFNNLIAEKSVQLLQNNNSTSIQYNPTHPFESIILLDEYIPVPNKWYIETIKTTGGDLITYNYANDFKLLNGQNPIIVKQFLTGSTKKIVCDIREISIQDGFMIYHFTDINDSQESQWQMELQVEIWRYDPLLKRRQKKAFNLQASQHNKVFSYKTLCDIIKAKENDKTDYGQSITCTFIIKPINDIDAEVKIGDKIPFQFYLYQIPQFDSMSLNTAKQYTCALQQDLTVIEETDLAERGITVINKEGPSKTTAAQNIVWEVKNNQDSMPITFILQSWHNDQVLPAYYSYFNWKKVNLYDDFGIYEDPSGPLITYSKVYSFVARNLIQDQNFQAWYGISDGNCGVYLMGADTGENSDLTGYDYPFFSTTSHCYRYPAMNGTYSPALYVKTEDGVYHFLCEKITNLNGNESYDSINNQEADYWPFKVTLDSTITIDYPQTTLLPSQFEFINYHTDARGQEYLTQILSSIQIFASCQSSDPESVINDEEVQLENNIHLFNLSSEVHRSLPYREYWFGSNGQRNQYDYGQSFCVSVYNKLKIDYNPAIKPTFNLLFIDNPSLSNMEQNIASYALNDV